MECVLTYLAIDLPSASLILTVLFNLVLMLQFDEESRRIVKGLVILLAVALYARLRSRP